MRQIGQSARIWNELQYAFKAVVVNRYISPRVILHSGKILFSMTPICVPRMFGGSDRTAKW